jgi:hypothetical protein
MKKMISGLVMVAWLGSLLAACEPKDDDDAALGLLLLLFIAAGSQQSLQAEDACPVVGESWCEGDQIMVCQLSSEEGSEAQRPAIRPGDRCGEGACQEEERDGRLVASCAGLPP